MSPLEKLVDMALQSTHGEMHRIIDHVKQILLAERERCLFGGNTVRGGLAQLQAKGELILIGDIHGDLDALYQILARSKFFDDMRAGRPVILIFMGDYGDRGTQSPEVYYVALALKHRYPDNVVLMRGNHEGPQDVEFYPFDLPEQFEMRFGAKGREVLGDLMRLWDLFYHAILVEGKYLILHGGVPTEADELDDIAFAHDRHPDRPHLIEILWNDPMDGIEGTRPSRRGIGRVFGLDVTQRVLRLCGAKLLLRGHEPCTGVRVNHEGLVLTIFSSKTPYQNPTAAYLRLRLQDEACDAYQLASLAEKF